ncbi:MAG: nitroreductase family protein [Nitrospiraceae bacterium]|nr:nitroreductase family protein [Nitrospiraceae bacterium]
MDAIDAILTRRSIRKYTAQPVPKELITELIRAAMSAPSAGNQQPWHFIVIDDRKTLDSIPEFHPHSLMLKKSPAAVLVCGDPSLETHKDYWMIDCSAATENFLLAAHAKGLGAVWLGIYPRQDRVANIRKLLNVPENIIPFSLISIGYPAEKRPAENRFKNERIHKNSW